MNSLGTDGTELYEALFGSSEYIGCLEEMFYQRNRYCRTLILNPYFVKMSDVSVGIK